MGDGLGRIRVGGKQAPAGDGGEAESMMAGTGGRQGPWEALGL